VPPTCAVQVKPDGSLIVTDMAGVALMGLQFVKSQTDAEKVMSGLQQQLKAANGQWPKPAPAATETSS